ncbi:MULTISPECIES: DUF3106 domain-containing protein [unclassified Luteimonas]
MTPRHPTEPAEAAAPTALGAFLRGVERRGLVFARLLAGSREAGDDALAWALQRFADEAGKTAFGEWPRRFWSLLLAAPSLRLTPAAPGWEPGFEWLSRIGHGPRAALLLRLVAGLAESDAASVLGIARPTYRLGLQRALPHRADGSADVDAWHALGRAAQDMQRALPPGSLALSLRAEGGVDGAAATPPARRGPLGRGVRAALWLVALATLGGLVATFVAIDRLPAGLDAAPGHILSEPLPMAEPPAGRYADEDALTLHPDLGLLLDADDQEAAAADPAFHAWLVAESEAEARAEAEAVSASPTTTSVPAAARPEPRPQPAGDRLAALEPAARARLAQRRDQWDALPHAERGERRERWLAWNDFSAAERAQLRDVAAAFALRSADERAALRARFDAMDASDRHGWLLGPDLGADYPRLHPLIAQVPLDARTALLEALRGLEPQARDDLAVLAARTAPQARAELRIELLATPAAQRARWLRRTVAPVQ